MSKFFSTSSAFQSINWADIIKALMTALSSSGLIYALLTFVAQFWGALDPVHAATIAAIMTWTADIVRRYFSGSAVSLPVPPI